MTPGSSDARLICPICGTPPADGTAICSEHQRHAIEPAAAARIERAPLIGRLVAERYLLVDLLGDGGMGTVYRGIDQRLDRPIAVKVLASHSMVKDDDRRRFEREAQALSRLHSEHTVTVYDYGVYLLPPTAENERPRDLAYIVLELVRGPDLFARIYDGPLCPADAASIVTDISHSLTEAHNAGIIHRDIKPSNVLLTTTPKGRQIAKLIDFGVARIDDARLTVVGEIMGTPQYMAPEQCTGGRTPVDARTDLYALGAMLYEMLSGHPPFDGDQAMEILFQQVKADPPPLPGNPKSRLRRRLEGAIHTAMAKRPDDRFPSVMTFAAEVDAAITEDIAEAATPLVSQASRPPQPVISTRPPQPPTVTSHPALIAPGLTAPSPRRRYATLIGLTAAALGAIIALLVLDRPDPPADPRPIEDTVPERITLGTPGTPGAPPAPTPTLTPTLDAGAPDAEPDAARPPPDAAVARPTRRVRTPKRSSKPDRGMLLQPVDW